MLASLKGLSHIFCHPFQTMSNINKCTISIQNIKNIFKMKAIWDEPIGKVQTYMPNSK
jgi:hypothetical protein